MRRTEALQGVRMAMFLNIHLRIGGSTRRRRRRCWASASGRSGAGRGLDVGGRRGRPRRPQARQGLGPAGPGGPGRGSGAALPRAPSGLHGQAFPRASHQGPRLRLGLRLAQAASAVVGRRAQGAAKGAHRRKRERRPLPGHDAAPEPAPAKAGDGARHAWLEGQAPLDRIVTLDDATGAIHSAFLIEEEGTASTFRALKAVFVEHGLPMSLFTDRGAHDFRTTKAGGIDRGCLTPGRPGARTTGGRAHRSLFAA